MGENANGEAFKARGERLKVQLESTLDSVGRWMGKMGGDARKRYLAAALVVSVLIFGSVRNSIRWQKPELWDSGKDFKRLPRRGEVRGLKLVARPRLEQVTAFKPATEEETSYVNDSKGMDLFTTDDRVLLLRGMRSAKVYLEWGAGGSTEMAARQDNIERIISVDSSIQWIAEDMKGYQNVMSAQQSGRLTFLHANIGKTRDWGVPDNTDTHLWANYANIVDFLQLSPDLIFVDGRFRVACVLKVFLKYNDVRPVVLVHDFWDRYERYGVITAFADVIARGDIMVAVRAKPDIDRDLLLRTFLLYREMWD